MLHLVDRKIKKRMKNRWQPAILYVTNQKFLFLRLNIDNFGASYRNSSTKTYGNLVHKHPNTFLTICDMVDMDMKNNPVFFSSTTSSEEETDL